MKQTLFLCEAEYITPVKGAKTDAILNILIKLNFVFVSFY